MKVPSEKKLKKIAKAAATAPKRSKAEVERVMARWTEATPDPIEFVGENKHPKDSFAYELRAATQKAKSIGAFLSIAAAIKVGGSTPASFLREWERRGLVRIGRRKS